MRRAIVCIAGLAFLWLSPVPLAHAHNGPPFPIVLDRIAGPYSISVWTDPDVGIGTFFVILAPAPGKTLLADQKVQVCVQPVNGRLPEACYIATRQNVAERVQYRAEVELDRQEMWKVRVEVSDSTDSAEVRAEVEATPPGFGAWDLLIYGFPFILFAMLWLVAALRGRRREKAESRSIDKGMPDGQDHPTSDVV